VRALDQPEHLSCWRVVGGPRLLDALSARDHPVLRLAPDDALVLGVGEPDVDDPHVIVVPESGFVGWELDADDVDALAHGYVEWELPSGRPALAQGLVAQVPAKLWLRDDGTALLLCVAPLAAELLERLA
jgi:hypothetical protein